MPTDTNPPKPVTFLNRVRGPAGKPVIFESPISFLYTAHLFALLTPISDSLATLAAFADAYPDLATRMASLEANVAKAMDVRVEVADAAARHALTLTQVQNGDFVSQLSPAKLYVVTDQTKLANADPAIAEQAFSAWNVVGPAGVGITSISQPSSDTQRFNLSDGSHYDVMLYRGTAGAAGGAGATGVGVTSISQPSADTQRFNLSDGSHYDITLYRGAAGAAGTDGADGTTLRHASGTLSKVVAAVTASSVLEFHAGSLFIGSTGLDSMSLTIDGVAATITFGFGSGDVSLGTQDPDTLIVTWRSEADITTDLAAYIDGMGFSTRNGWNAVAGQTMSLVYCVTLTAPAPGPSHSASFTGGTFTDGGFFIGDVVTGADESGAIQVELAAIETSKAHRLHSSSFQVMGAAAWTTANVQIGYLAPDTITFYPLLILAVGAITANARGFNTFALEDISTLIDPMVGMSLIARTSVSGEIAAEATGSDLKVYVTYSTE